jgi:hypothetical protein
MTHDLLKRVYNACDPGRPAEKGQYRDCSKARGDDSFVARVKTCLGMEEGHVCFLFSGHIGCGKSSELEALRRGLTESPIGGGRYCPIFINAGDYLDPYDVDTIDVLLAIVTELAATLRVEFGIELKSGYFSKRFDELKRFLLSDVQIGKGELPVLGAKIEVQRLKKDPDARQAIRKKLEPQMSTVLEEVNHVLLEAKQKLDRRWQEEEREPLRDFVLIVDDLEKIRRFGKRAEGLESHHELFLERASQLRSIEAHVVYTLPLNFARQAGTRLQQLYGTPPVVLPMVKVFHRGRPDKPFLEGCKCLKQLLAQRVTPGSVNEVLAADALEFLLDACGGHVRQLMQFVREAITYARAKEIDPPLPLPVAQQAIGQTITTYSTMIPERHWPKLIDLECSPDQRIPVGDPDYLEMLEQLSILEYVNGGDDSFEPWYAVHPIVRRLDRFKREMKLKTDRGGLGLREQRKPKK